MSERPLDPYSDLIREELSNEDATNESIQQVLQDHGVKTSREAVRMWVNSYVKTAGLPKRKKGKRSKSSNRVRKKSVVVPPDVTASPLAESALELPKGNHSFLKFLSDEPYDVTRLALIASALDLFVGSKDSRLTRRFRAAGEVFEMAGAQIDQSVAPGQWILPAAEMAFLSDLELTLIAFLLSDLPGLPNRGTGTEYKIWLHELLEVAARLKAKIEAGENFTFAELG